MLIWVLHLPQNDGSVLTKPFTSTDDIVEYFRVVKGAASISNTGPIQPKVGDYKHFQYDDKTGYAILGQVRYN